MKILTIIVSALVLTSCMTANMLEAERSYYRIGAFMNYIMPEE